MAMSLKSDGLRFEMSSSGIKALDLMGDSISADRIGRVYNGEAADTD